MDVLMPQPGETVAEASITQWFKAVGDTVGVGDALFEIDTDKTAMEVPATVGGILTEIRVETGAVAAVNTIVAVIATAGEAPSQKAANGQAPASDGAGPEVDGSVEPHAPAPAPAQRVGGRYGAATLANGTKVTPLARRLAAERGIDLLQVDGSGPRGRIVAADVHDGRAATNPAPATPNLAEARLPAATTSTLPEFEAVRRLYEGTHYDEVALDGMRSTIARRLVESKQTIPHFYVAAEVDVEDLLALRERVNAAGKARITVNDFIVKAFALALILEPEANAVWAGDRVLRFRQCDVGVAMSVEGGLFTPVIRQAEAKSLGAISAEIKELASRARDRRLKPNEYQGGAAAVSNLGMFGVRQFQAIINPPHATILAVGAVGRRPVEQPDGTTAWRSRLTATLSVDHRVVDGALAARLLSAFASIVEQPISILV